MKKRHAAERNLKLLDLLAFFGGFRGYEGVLVVYFATVAGSFTTAMTILASMHLSASIFEVPTGIWSDRIGRKRTVVWARFASFLAVLAYYIGGSSAMLVAGAMLTGFSMALNSGTVSAFVYENLEVLGRKDDFKKVQGRRLALGRYALFASSVIGSAIIYVWDIRTAILVTLITLSATLVCSMLLRDTATAEPGKGNIYADIAKAWKGFLRDPMLRDLSLGRMAARGIGNAEYRFRSLFFASFMPEWIVNLLGMLNNLVSGIAMHGAHWVVQKIGMRRALVHIDVLDRVATTGLALTGSVTGSIAMNTMTGTAFGIREVASDELLQKRYSKKQRATMGSIVGLGGSLLYSAVAIVAGFLADRIGLLQTLITLQCVLLLAPYFFSRGIEQETRRVR